MPPRTFTKSPNKPKGRFGDKKRDSRGGPEGARGGPGGSRFFQKKTCRFCAERALTIDFKDPDRIKRFLTEKGKIMPRRITGNCAKHQRILSRSIKRARHAAIVAFQID
jgi:small subunit ribosomal protein S18